ncbi:MAG: nucleotidyltransferase substrate binding protein [Sphingomonadaceae bacterium]
MDAAQPAKPRWQHRFDNFSRAFLLLREAIEISTDRELSQLEKEGVIQRFEYTWELAWKTLKDVLDDQGVVLATVTPKSVIKEAFAAKLIDDGDIWMRALDARNQMSHVYNLKVFEQVIAAIRSDFLALFDDLHTATMARIVDPGAT